MKFKRFLSTLFILFGIIIWTRDSLNQVKLSNEKIYYLENYRSSYSDIKTHDSKLILDNSYIGILKIPKINLEQGLVDPSSKLNDVAYNICIIPGSNMPSEENSRLILASHSGNSKISYFKNLDNLNIGDLVEVELFGIAYEYVVEEKELIPKTEETFLKNIQNSLSLITCQKNSDKRLVVTCKKISSV